MKVAQIIDTLYYGGAQTMQVMLAQVMNQRAGADLTVISLREDSVDSPIPALLEAQGAKVRFFAARKLFNPRRFRQLISHLRRERYDVIHTHLPHANVLGTIAGKAAGTPVVASIRNTFADRGRFYVVLHSLETLVLRCLANHVMAVGQTTAAFHQRRLGKKTIEAVPSALDVRPPLPADDRFQLRRELVGDPDRPLLISVGRLVGQKGYSDLLAAFSRVHRQHPSAYLVIAGEGPLRSELEAQIVTLGLPDHVRLLGGRGDVARLLLASDLFVSSSHWEGLSVAVLEAMAAGLPVVGTSVSDMPRVVVEGTGLLVPPQSPPQLAAAMSLLLEDRNRRESFGRAARDFIESHHNPADWADQIFRMYASVQRNGEK